MKESPLPSDEVKRLATLNAMNILDTAPEERFDRITRVAARTLSAPIALISLVDAKRQWFKSCQGLSLKQIPRGISFCGHAILDQDIFVVPDTLKDPRFADNPLVVGEPHVRFYAGQPLSAPDGSRIGTLCIMDQRPRQLGPDALNALRDLAAWAEHELNDIELDQTATIVNDSETRMRTLVNTISEGIITFTELGAIDSLNPAAERIFGYKHAEAVGLSIKKLIPEIDQAKQVKTNRLRELTGYRKDGDQFTLESTIDQMPLQDHRLFITAVRDVTERNNILKELAGARDRYLAICENAADFISTHTMKGTYLFASSSALKTLGYNPSELIGINFLTHIHPNDRKVVLSAYKKLADNDDYCRVRYRIKRKDGIYIWLETYARVIAGVHTGDQEILSVSRDVEEQLHIEAWLIEEKKAVKRGKAIEKLSHRDELTGLMNRRAVDQVLTARLASRRIANYPFGVLLLDVDHFKKVNDTYGHAIGDLVLKEVARVIAKCCRSNDQIGRYDGDEFVIVLPNTGVAGTITAGEAIVQAIKTWNWPDLRSNHNITVSIGATSVSHPGEISYGDLLSQVDIQLYEAKQRGRNRLVMNKQPTGVLTS